MSGTDTLDDATADRESLRAVLALVCVLAVVLAVAALPALTLADAAGPDGGPLGGDGNRTDDRPVGDGRGTPGDGATPGEFATPPGPVSSGDGVGEQSGSGQPGDGVGERPGSGGDTASGDAPRGGTDGQPSSGQTDGQPSSGQTGGRPGSAGGDAADPTGGVPDGDTAGRQRSGDGGGSSGNGAADGPTAGQPGDSDTDDQRGGVAAGQQRGGETATQRNGTTANRTRSGTGDTTASRTGEGTREQPESGDAGNRTRGGDPVDGDGDRSGQGGNATDASDPSGGGTPGQASGGDSTDGRAGGGDTDEDGASRSVGDDGGGDDSGRQSSGGDTGGRDSDSRPSGGDESGGDDSDSQSAGGESGGADETSAGENGDETDSQGGDEGSGEGERDDPAGGTADGYTVSLNRSATAGAAVEVTVTRDGEPAAGVAVSFNGDPVGTTDTAGTVVGRVPYEPRLDVSVAPESQGSLSRPDGGGRLLALAGPRATNESFVVNTNATLSISGSVVTGGTATVTATVADVPVRGAAVTVDGRRVGRTDDSGRARVSLPTAPGNYTVAVSRGSVRGERTLALAGLTVETGPTLPLALPGTGLDVRVTAGGDPVPNATVALDGDRVAVTDGNGTATAGLPFAGSATVTVRAYGQTRERVVGGLLWNLAGVLAAGLALVAGTGYLARRRGVSRATVAGWPRRTSQLAVHALLWLAAALDGAIARLCVRAVRTVRALRALLARRRTPAELWAALLAWVMSRLAATRRSADAAATDARRGDRDEGDDRTTVRAAWGRFVAQVSLARPRTATPGEIAAHAIEVDDSPAEAVGTLRDAYRAVEYGQYEPGDHVAAVERAIETIESEADDGGETA